jgi:broad specificity phosphatase PhoE
MITVYLVRHGENVANLTKEFSYRKVDHSLTPKGRLQAEQTAAYFKGKGIQAIYTSPLKRATETAEIIGQALGLDYTVVEAFRELNVGNLEEPPPTDEKWRIHYGVWFEWFQGNLSAAFPGGEDYHIVSGRFRDGMQAVLNGNAGDSQLIVVGHGGIFMAGLSSFCAGVSMAELVTHEYHNGSISELHLTRESGAWRCALARFADASHITGDAADFVQGYPDVD